MAILALGSMVDYMKVHDPDWSRDIAARLEERLGVHGKFCITDFKE